MGFRINTNVLSLTSQRSLSTTTKALARSLERLASGKRINRAGDDAAGLAISTALEAEKRGMTQALRNMNDARGFVGLAEASIAEQTNILHRMRELALQSANGTLSSADRGYLNSEFQQLLSEIGRVAEQTNFNGVKLLDGSFGSKTLQVGTTKEATIGLSITSTQVSDLFKKSVGSGTYKSRVTMQAGPFSSVNELSDLNEDGILDLVTNDYDGAAVSVHLGTRDGSFAPRTSFQAAFGPIDIAIGDIDNDGNKDIVTQNYTSEQISIFLGNGDGSFKTQTTFASAPFAGTVELGDLDGDGDLDLVAGSYGSQNTHIYFNNGSGVFGAAQTMSFPGPYNSKITDLNGDGKMDIIGTESGGNTFAVHLGNGDGTFQAKSQYLAASIPTSLELGDLNKDGYKDVTVFNYIGQSASVYLGASDGTFTQSSTINFGFYPGRGELTDVNGDGNLDVVATNSSSTGYNNSVHIALGNGDGRFQSIYNAGTVGSGPTDVSATDLDGDGAVDLIVSDQQESTISILYSILHEVPALDELDVTTQASASNVLTILDGGLNRLNEARASLGALQSRLDYAAENAGVTIENLAQAKSQILDTDYAEETAELTRHQILQQAGVSVLGQANLQMRTALALLNF